MAKTIAERLHDCAQGVSLGADGIGWSPDPALLRESADEIDRLRTALEELRDRIKNHPAYADLTEAEEIETGGDTAELSYLARVADAALGS